MINIGPAENGDARVLVVFIVTIVLRVPFMLVARPVPACVNELEERRVLATYFRAGFELGVLDAGALRELPK